MRQFTKLLAALAVLFLAVAFISCSGPNSSTNDEPQDVVFASESRTYGPTSTAISSYNFKTDGTYEARDEVSNGDVYINSQGTYTGDPSTDGDLILTQKKVVDYNNYPNLKDCEEPYQTYTITISNGKFTLSTTEFTRQ